MASKPIVITILANARAAQRTINQLQKALRDLNKNIKGDKLGEFGRQLSITAAKMGVFATAAAAASPAVLHLGAALVPTVGALGTIPGLLVAGASAMGAFKIATQGVSDAIGKGFSAVLNGSAADIKAYNKALEDLVPAQREFVKSAVAMAPALEEIQKSVAGAFFKDLGNVVQGLAKQYLPLLNNHLTKVAGSLNKAAKGVANFFRLPSTQGSIEVILKNVETAIDEVAKAAPSILKGLLPLFRVSSKFLPQLAMMFGESAKSFEEFMKRISGTGQLERWIQGGITALKQLWQITKNVAAIFTTIFAASGASGNDLLATVVKLTGTFKEWLRSAEGASVLADIFRTVETLMATVQKTGGDVFKQIAESIKILAPALLEVAPAAGGLISAIAPALPAFAALAVTLTKAILPAVITLTEYLAKNEDVVKALATVVGSLVVAMKIYSVTAAAIGVATKAWAIATGLLNVSLIASKIQIGLNVAAILAYQSAVAVVGAATKVWTAIQWLFNAAMMANPIGLILIAIVALVAAIILAYKNSETFRKIVNAALKGVGQAFTWLWNRAKDLFGWLKNNWKLVLAIITGPLGLAIRWINQNWDKIRTTFINVFKAIFNFLTYLPRKFIEIGKGLIDGLLRGILNSVPMVKKVLTKLGDFIPDWLAKPLGIRSPSTVFRKLGEDTIDGFIKGFESTSGKEIVGQLAKDMQKTAVAVQGTVDLGAQGAGTVAAGAAVGGGDTLVINQYFQGLITDPAQAGQEAVSAIEAWQRISGNIRLVPQT